MKRKQKIGFKKLYKSDIAVEFTIQERKKIISKRKPIKGEESIAAFLYFEATIIQKDVLDEMVNQFIRLKGLYWKWTDKQCVRSNKQDQQAIQKAQELYDKQAKKFYDKYADFYDDFVSNVQRGVQPNPLVHPSNHTFDYKIVTDLDSKRLLSRFAFEIENFYFRDKNQLPNGAATGALLDICKENQFLLTLEKEYQGLPDKDRGKEDRKWDWVLNRYLKQYKKYSINNPTIDKDNFLQNQRNKKTKQNLDKRFSNNENCQDDDQATPAAEKIRQAYMRAKKDKIE